MMKINPLTTLAAGLALAVLGTSGVALACRCTIPPLQEQMQRSAAVFAGRVVKVTVKNDSAGFPTRWARFEVSRAWKGVASRTVVVNTGFGDGDCGYRFEMGREFLVYAVADKKRLYTNICTRTTELAAAKEDIEALGVGQAVR